MQRNQFEIIKRGPKNSCSTSDGRKFGDCKSIELMLIKEMERIYMATSLELAARRFYDMSIVKHFG